MKKFRAVNCSKAFLISYTLFTCRHVKSSRLAGIFSLKCFKPNWQFRINVHISQYNSLQNYTVRPIFHTTETLEIKILKDLNWNFFPPTLKYQVSVCFLDTRCSLSVMYLINYCCQKRKDSTRTHNVFCLNNFNHGNVHNNNVQKLKNWIF